MSNISKIKISGTSYNIKDENACNVVELTQAEYDALPATAKTSNTLFVITDAQGGDLSNYYTKNETDDLLDEKLDVTAYTPTDLTNYYTKSETSGATQISTALNGKQETLVSGTNIKTINNTSLLGSGNIDIQGGGSVTVDTELDSGSTNPVQNKVIYAKIDEVEQVTAAALNSLNDALSGKQDTLIAGDNITISGNVISASGGGSSVNVVQTTGTSTTDVMSQDAVTTQLSGYVTTDTEQIISVRKIFTYASNGSTKAIEFRQTDDSSRVGFRIINSAETNNELATFEFRPNTFTVDNVRHPLLYFGHYRNTNTANAGVPQTVIGFRQYDQKNAAAYHYLMPLPEKAKTPFSLTKTFKDYYAPIGFKNGSTMITADETGVVDLSSELDGLKLKKLTQQEYDALVTKDNSTVYIIVN